ncbi:MULTISPECIES: hypothetical protein [unclassified Adlercreutzia]|uniref:hypothetical protein n=1 Tax=unclassified Adlercreutzia TaxID=2636013 RepID=UPI0013EC84ED|nr:MULTISPECIES: hypothetical protein [unclassified Adlercreutzia]
MANRKNTIADVLPLVGGSRLEGRSSAKTLDTIVGTAVSDSAGGLVKVKIDGTVITDDNNGNIVEVPTSVKVIEGDTVTITTSGNKVITTPLVTDVIGGGDRTQADIDAAAQAAEQAEKVAGEAQAAAKATDQHFFTDDNGVHVATTPSEPDQGPNLLANSVGIMLRDGTILRTAMTPSGFAVYDGVGNEDGNIVALFGDITTIGRKTGPRVILDKDSIDMFSAYGLLAHIGNAMTANGTRSGEWIPFFHFGEQVDYGDGSPGSGSFVGGAGCKAEGPYAQAFGADCSAAGAFSHASGIDSKATGSGAWAHGTGINASTGMVVGQYNATPIGGAYFTVGSGTSNTDRRNTLSVTDGGIDLYDNDLYITRGQVLDTITQGDGTISTAYFSSGTVRWVKSGHIVQVFIWLKLKQALATYSALNTVATNLPRAIRAGETGILKIDNTTGTCFPNVDTNGNLKIVSRETSIAANGVITGGFTYISSE